MGEAATALELIPSWQRVGFWAFSAGCQAVFPAACERQKPSDVMLELMPGDLKGDQSRRLENQDERR